MKNENKMGFILFFLIVIASLLRGSLFIVEEGEQAIITQFGRPIGDPISNSGLHFKIPFVQTPRFVDKRILSWDGQATQIPTKDKKYIKVDTTARWKIVDVLKFIQTVQNEHGALSRLDTILASATRDVVSNHNSIETIRNSNAIITRIDEMKSEFASNREKGLLNAEEEVFGEVERVTVGREELSLMIYHRAKTELAPFGIEVMDVQLKRVSYESKVEDKIYERMISERQRIAEKIRSYGQGERAKIEGRLGRDLKNIESEAYKQAQIIRGKAEATATKIYATAFSQGASFFEFIRSMEAYERTFSAKTRFILSSDSVFLKYLK